MTNLKWGLMILLLAVLGILLLLPPPARNESKLPPKLDVIAIKQCLDGNQYAVFHDGNGDVVSATQMFDKHGPIECTVKR
ncbi:MAG: hypothetical protein KAS32_05355 [Candidatus Peribacteraceae bacterium]|nr:hypothetical protein [Candidatus Peribacteraceae bacterium]